MTLPLIIVPAIALLRPPGQTSGISDTVAQSAESDGFEFPPEFTVDSKPKNSSAIPDGVENEDVVPAEDSDYDFDSSRKPVAPKRRTPPPAEKVDEIFPAPEDNSESHELPRKEIPDKPSRKVVPSESEADISPKGNDVPSSETVVRQLNALGAVRTLWFDAGEASPVGFAAFFRGDTELMRYRFEAVGQTRAECAENVLKQVTQWRNAAAK